MTVHETNINECIKDPEVAVMIDNKEYKEHVCKVCDKKILFGKSAHIKKYHTGNIIKCPKCNKSFNTFVRAMSHIRNIHEKKPCTICGKIIQNNSMTTHIQQAHTANDEKKFKCETCGKGFVANNALQDHINTHTGEKPHVCKACVKGFASYGNLRTHIQREHTANDEKKFKCETCGKGFVVNNKLQDHINIHTGEKPYVCKACGKGFANHGNLRTHERGHEEMK